MAQDGNEIAMRIALVQKHRLAGFLRKLQLSFKSPALLVLRREIAEIIEAAFTHGHHFRFRQQSLQRDRCSSIETLGLMRVCAGGAIKHARPYAAKFQGLAAVLNVAASNDELHYAGFLRPMYHLVAIG